MWPASGDTTHKLTHPPQALDLSRRLGLFYFYRKEGCPALGPRPHKKSKRSDVLAIKFIDLFSGAGGFREGLERAGGFACVGHCEIDQAAPGRTSRPTASAPIPLRLALVTNIYPRANINQSYLPLPVVLAHRLTQQLDTARRELPFLGPDGKAQVTVEYDELGRPSRIDTVVLSAQHSQDVTQDELFFELTDKVVMPALSVLPPDENTKLLLDPAGGGPDVSTGITGRKVTVDTYSVFAPHGGGSFSGKDPTQVERSGAYMARYIAKNLVAARLCKRCQVTLAYAMGREQPVAVHH